MYYIVMGSVRPSIDICCVLYFSSSFHPIFIKFSGYYYHNRSGSYLFVSWSDPFLQGHSHLSVNLYQILCPQFLFLLQFLSEFHKIFRVFLALLNDDHILTELRSDPFWLNCGPYIRISVNRKRLCPQLHEVSTDFHKTFRILFILPDGDQIILGSW